MSDSRILPAVQAEVLPLPGRWSGLRSGNLPVLPIAILGILILTAIFADVLAPSDPEVGTLTDRFKPPAWVEGGSRAHLLGTDHVGRDALSRLLFGARVSIVVGFVAVIVAGAIGTTLGILAGYLGGWGDQVTMRLTHTWLAVPGLTFAIFLAAIYRPNRMKFV